MFRTISEVDLTGDNMKPNASRSIKDRYHELMSISDPGELCATLDDLMQSFVGKGMSKEGMRKWQIRFKQASQQGLAALQKKVTDYMLNGSGMPGDINRRYGTEGLRRGPSLCETRRAAEFGIAAIAAVITEDPNDVMDIQQERHRMRYLMEEQGKQEQGQDNGQDDGRNDSHEQKHGTGQDQESIEFDKAANIALRGLKDAIAKYPKAARAKKADLAKLVGNMLK